MGLWPGGEEWAAAGDAGWHWEGAGREGGAGARKGVGTGIGV